MDINELKKSIEIAHQAVSDEIDPYKLESFKIILKSLVRSYLEKQIVTDDIPHELSSKGGVSQRYASQGSVEIEDYKIGMQKLAKNCNITIDELKNVISINGDLIELLPRDKIFGDIESKQLVNASQVVLAAHEIIFKTEWVKSSTLSPCLKGAGIMDINRNLSGKLKSTDDIFRKRPNANEYKLTNPKGINSAFEIIKKLAKGEKLEN